MAGVIRLHVDLGLHVTRPVPWQEWVAPLRRLVPTRRLSSLAAGATAHLDALSRAALARLRAVRDLLAPVALGRMLIRLVAVRAVVIDNPLPYCNMPMQVGLPDYVVSFAHNVSVQQQSPCHCHSLWTARACEKSPLRNAKHGKEAWC